MEMENPASLEVQLLYWDPDYFWTPWEGQLEIRTDPELQDLGIALSTQPNDALKAEYQKQRLVREAEERQRYLDSPCGKLREAEIESARQQGILP